MHKRVSDIWVEFKAGGICRLEAEELNIALKEEVQQLRQAFRRGSPGSCRRADHAAGEAAEERGRPGRNSRQAGCCQGRV